VADRPEPFPPAGPDRAGAAPPPPGPPGSNPAGGHTGIAGKLSNRAIAAIALAIVAVAGGVVALVVLLGNHGPARPGPLRPVAAPAPVTSARTVSFTVQLAKAGNAHPGKRPKPAPAGKTYSFGNGVTLTPVKGWSSANPVKNGVNLVSPDGGAELFAEEFSAPQASDPAAELNSFNVPWLSNIQLSGAVQTGSIQGSTDSIASEAIVQFSANQSTNQGTMQVYGAFVLLLDPQHFEVFCVYEAASISEYNANSKSAIAMISVLAGTG